MYHTFVKIIFSSLRKQFLWIKETFLWSTVKEKISLKLKKVLLIQKIFLWSKEVDLFALKKIFLSEQNFFQFKEIFSLSIFFLIYITSCNFLRKLNRQSHVDDATDQRMSFIFFTIPNNTKLYHLDCFFKFQRLLWCI